MEGMPRKQSLSLNFTPFTVFSWDEPTSQMFPCNSMIRISYLFSGLFC